MKKAIIMSMIVLVALFLAARPSYCQEGQGEGPSFDENLRVFDGKVTGVDVGGSTLTVKEQAEITFPISLDTKLVNDINDIKLSDIAVGDYVTVEYTRKGNESRVPVKVFKVTQHYRGTSGI